MKFFLVVLTVALVALVNVSSAEDKKSSYQVAKELVALAAERFEIIYKEIPDTEAFKPYRHEIMEFIKLYKTRDENIFCFQKLLKCMDLIKESFDKLTKSESKEAKEVLEIFEKYRDADFAEKINGEMDHSVDPTESEAIEIC